MLLIPVEDRGSWRSPPVLILLIFVLNLVIHLHTQSRYRSPDTQFDHYVDAEQSELLVQKEWPLFLDWIENERPGLWVDLRDTEPSERRQNLRYHAWLRGDFSAHVRQHWKNNTPPSEWRQARENLEQWRSKQPSIRHGLVPNDVQASSLLTHMFMHGGWAHLFGNMLFLFLFGVPMERHWGIRRLALMYLLCGLGSVGLFIAFNAGSGVPLVGASGAIAGLMGIYATSYGFRRIEFFYTLGFLFGSFRAPAFMVFPLWVALELIQDLVLDTHVAYMAHVGGLLTGAGVTLVLQRIWPSHALAADDAQRRSPGVSSEQARQSNAIPDSIENQVRAFNFDQALELALRRLDEHPDWPELWRYSMEVAPRAEASQGPRLLQLAARKRQAGKIGDKVVAALWQQARTAKVDTRNLSPATLLVTAESLVARDMAEESRALVDQLKAEGVTHPRLEQLQKRLEQAGPPSPG